MEPQAIVISGDTLHIVTSSPGHSWGTIIPWVGLGLTIIGWFINSLFSRSNTLKAFEEGVLDKIRIEINSEITKYTAWVDMLHTQLYLVYQSELETYYEEFPKLNSLLQSDQFGSLMNAFNNYQNLFRPLVPILSVVNRYQSKIINEMAPLVQTRPLGKNEARLEEVGNGILQIKFFTAQFFEALQYDCLQSLKRVRNYKNKKQDGRLFYIDENGVEHIYDFPKQHRFRKFLDSIVDYF